jgi:hypothetical protein
MRHRILVNRSQQPPVGLSARSLPRSRRRRSLTSFFHYILLLAGRNHENLWRKSLPLGVALGRVEDVNLHLLSMIPQSGPFIMRCGLIISAHRLDLKDDMIGCNASRFVRHAECSTETPPG